MPTALPTRLASGRCLSWPDTARLLILVARVRLLDLRAHRLVDRNTGPADDRLLRLMRQWLAVHEAIGRLLPGIAEPEHVREVRAILTKSGRPSAPVDRVRRTP